MNEKLDTKIQDALKAAPMDWEPNEDLVRKLRVLAHETAPRPLWRRARFSVPAGAAAAVAAVVVAATMMPAQAGAKSFDLIVAAAQRINAFQFSILSEDGGKPESLTIAGVDGHVVVRTGGDTVMEFEGGGMSVYDPKENKAMRFKFGGLVDAETVAKEMQSGIAEGLKEMDLKKMLQEYAQKYGQNGIRISPVTRESGRNVYHVALANGTEPERVEMTVDAATDLPERLHVETREGGNGWHDAVTMELRFGDRVDPSLLRSTIPKNAKVEELDLGSMVGDALKGLGDLASGGKTGVPSHK